MLCSIFIFSLTEQATTLTWKLPCTLLTNIIFCQHATLCFNAVIFFLLRAHLQHSRIDSQIKDRPNKNYLKWDEIGTIKTLIANNLQIDFIAMTFVVDIVTLHFIGAYKAIVYKQSIYAMFNKLKFEGNFWTKNRMAQSEY